MNMNSLCIDHNDYIQRIFSCLESVSSVKEVNLKYFFDIFSDKFCTTTLQRLVISHSQ